MRAGANTYEDMYENGALSHPTQDHGENPHHHPNALTPPLQLSTSSQPHHQNQQHPIEGEEAELDQARCQRQVFQFGGSYYVLDHTSNTITSYVALDDSKYASTQKDSSTCGEGSIKSGDIYASSSSTTTALWRGHEPRKDDSHALLLFDGIYSLPRVSVQQQQQQKHQHHHQQSQLSAYHSSSALTRASESELSSFSAAQLVQRAMENMRRAARITVLGNHRDAYETGDGEEKKEVAAAAAVGMRSSALEEWLFMRKHCGGGGGGAEDFMVSHPLPSMNRE